MSFTLKIGSASRSAGEVGITRIAKETIRSPRGTRRYRRETWDLTGMIQVSRTTDIDAAMLRFERELTDGSDVVFVNAQNQETAHKIKSLEAMGGVQINRLQWGPSTGAEHSTFRSYELQLEALFRLQPIGPDLLEFRESITFIGGGPRWMLNTLTRGEPERQGVNEKTAYRAIQSGSALGEFSRPFPPNPIWPNHEHTDQRIIEPTSPRIFNGERTEYGIRWQYDFESGRPLIGEPNVR